MHNRIRTLAGVGAYRNTPLPASPPNADPELIVGMFFVGATLGLPKLGRASLPLPANHLIQPPPGCAIFHETSY
jgi:hypothetical protein